MEDSGHRAASVPVSLVECEFAGFIHIVRDQQSNVVAIANKDAFCDEY